MYRLLAYVLPNMGDESLSVSGTGPWNAGVLVINTLPPDIAIERTIPFLRLVAIFNQTEKTKYDVMDVLESGPIFSKFYDFVFHNIIKHKIVIQEELAHVLMSKIEDLRTKYQQDDMEKWRDKIFEEVFRKEGVRRKDDLVRRAHKKFRRAWFDMDDVFDQDIRRVPDENGNFPETFTHLIGTMQILFEELLPTMLSQNDAVDDNGILRSQRPYLILIALLHDVVEKDPRFNEENLTRDFGQYVAKGVMLLSKKELSDYMTEAEQYTREHGSQKEKEFVEHMAKEKRNHDYFKDLAKLDIGYLAVKIADRIHNLKTMKGEPIVDIKRKLAETKKYFLIPEIQERIPAGYRMIEIKVRELETYLQETKEK